MTSGAPLHVLVVDDEPLIAWSLAATLQGAGDTVVEANDGAGAIRAVTEGPRPDVVLLDFQLPDSKDLGLLATLRRLAPHSAVILMSAYITHETANRALEEGAFRVIAKPVDMNDVPGMVRAAADSLTH